MNRRLVGFLGRSLLKSVGTYTQVACGLFSHFLVSATMLVDRFGPAWTRQKVRRRSLGVWLLILIWTTPFLATMVPLLVKVVTKVYWRMDTSAAHTHYRDQYAPGMDRNH